MSSSKSKKVKKEIVADSGEESKDKSIKLSNSRFLTVSEFKNRVRVDIREFYLNDDGERKPGRKGISLSLEEWKKITNNIEKIEKAIKDLSGDSSDSD